MDEHVSEEIKDFEVVLVEHHLDIETCELAQVTVGVGVLSTEDWTDLENSLHVTAKDHLLVELRALSEASLLAEVVKSEDVGTTFGSTTDKLG
jgi:hypothetical protein